MQILSVIGNVILGLFFVIMGINHFGKMKVMADYAKSKKVPAPGLAVFVTGLMLLFGGLSVLTGAYLEYGLWLLVIFLFFVSFWMHNFWADKNAEMKMNNMVNFLKNMALMGAILMLMMYQDAWTCISSIPSCS